MSASATEMEKMQTLLLSGLTPGHHSITELRNHLDTLVPTPSHGIPRSFDNVVLFNTDKFRSDALHQVDELLDQYRDVARMARYHHAEKIEKDLLWAALQLYARLQAIHHDVGLVLEPKTEYAQCLEKLQACQVLLTQNRSAQSAKLIGALLDYATVNASIREYWEQFVEYFIELRQWESFFSWFINQIDKRNETRLFWVWGRPNVDLVLGWLGQKEAQDRLSETKFIPGHISWALYAFRGTLFFLQYMHKQMNDPKWLKATDSLSPEERAIYRSLYIKAYWDVYKYRILNDYVWGAFNLVCYGWWTGWAGDVCTSFLLCMDIYLTDLNYSEAKLQYKTIQENHEQRLTQLSQDMEGYGARLSSLSRENVRRFVEDDERKFCARILQGESLTQEEQAYRQLVVDWLNVDRVQQEHQKKWQKKSQFLEYDCIYAKVLLFAFFICVSLLVPGLLPASLNLFLSSSGTVLCMALTIIYRTARVELKVSQSQQDIRDLRQYEQQCFFQFIELQSKQSSAECVTKAMQDLYLDLVNVGRQINVENDVIQYERLELARTTLLRVLIPTLIGLASVYMAATLPIYGLVLAFSAVLAYALDVFVRQYKPAELQVSSTLNERQYLAFCQRPKVFGQSEGGFFEQRHLQSSQEESAAVSQTAFLVP